MTRRHPLLTGTAIAGMAALPSIAHACWADAEQRYGVPAKLLQAVARVESGLDPGAVNLTHRSRTGTYDIGLMQINSSHLPQLARHGISEHDLFRPCTNILVGAWLLADALARHGYRWEGVGAYNAACSSLKGAACQQARAAYAWRVYRRLDAEAPTARQPAVRSYPVGLISAAEVVPDVTSEVRPVAGVSHAGHPQPAHVGVRP